MREGPLIVGLGNPLNGDAGVGVRILELLATDERLPENVELVSATPEFVRQRDYLKGRTRVILLDAFLAEPVGELRELEDAALRALDPAAGGPGEPMSARHALDLLEQAESDLLAAELSVVGVTVGEAAPELRPGLSDPVEAGARAACTRVIERLAAGAAD
jgi:hydrogenase maturation protease